MTDQPNLSRQVAAALRHDLNAFVRKSFSTLNPGQPFEPGWYIEAMTYELGRVARGENTRLLITIPPRHLKSITASVAFPAWALGHEPTLRFIVASYGGDLALKHARDFRSVLESDWYRYAFRGVGALVRSAEGDVVTRANGGRKAVSLGGALTGFGADIIIIDDLMKASDASSSIERQRVKDFYEQTLLSRLNDQRDGRIIAIQQRLHEDDLTGFLKEKGGFKHLNLPAICQEDTGIPIGAKRLKRRIRGEVLSPREPREVLDRLRIDLGPAAFSAQYLQDPVAPEGNLIRWDRIGMYDVAPDRGDCQLLVQSWDTGITATSTSDFSVGTTWGLCGKVWYLLDLFRARIEYPDLIDAVRRERDRWQADLILVERAGSGFSLLQDLEREWRAQPFKRSRRGERPGWRLAEYRPTSDKRTRLGTQVAKLEEGFALLPSKAPWLAELRHELKAFPGKHDDQVDSVTQFLEYAGTLHQPRAENRSIRLYP